MTPTIGLVDRLVEQNATLRAKVDELTALIEFWTVVGRLQTYEDRERFRRAAALAVNSQHQSTPGEK